MNKKTAPLIVASFASNVVKDREIRQIEQLLTYLKR